MKRLKFDGFFREAIELGKKTCTTRRTCDFQKGDLVLLEFTDTNYNLRATITDTYSQRFDLLREDTAYDEGYLDSGIFKQALKSFYPGIENDDEVWTICFRIMRDKRPRTNKQTTRRIKQQTKRR